MIAPHLLDILCCPESHQPLALADSALIDSLNTRIAAGELRSRTGKPVTEKLDGALVRADRQFLYPIRSNIPVLLVDEAIPFSG